MDDCTTVAALNNKHKYVFVFLNGAVRESCSPLHPVVTDRKKGKRLRVFIIVQLKCQAETLAENHTGKPFH